MVDLSRKTYENGAEAIVNIAEYYGEMKKNI